MKPIATDAPDGDSEPVIAVHRLRLGHGDAHYGGGLVAGGRLMELLGDVATELCIASDGDEGLLAAYDSVNFLLPAHAGDFLEVRGRIVRTGRSSRAMELEVLRYARALPHVSESAAELLAEPESVLNARCTCVVPTDKQRGGTP
ncbi:MAG: 3-aminobutyryl-CoA ammonia lyase [Actinobacteria bacterium]|nr:3-aminobutyryl-CoA ammonia lyase [Actinomycetota bacterium]